MKDWILVAAGIERYIIMLEIHPDVKLIHFSDSSSSSTHLHLPLSVDFMSSFV